MSRGDLALMLKERARMQAMGWTGGLGLSLLLHLALGGGVVLFSRTASRSEEPKVTWVSLPGAGGASGGSAATEAGDEGERQRRVEDVAPRADTAKGASSDALPDPIGRSGRQSPARGDNPDQGSLGRGRTAAKGAAPNPASQPGAAGSGGGGGVGEGSGVPGLRSSLGAQGGTGLITGLDGNFLFTRYAQTMQNRIIANWTSMGSGSGRCVVYYRIGRNGQIDGVRVETTSGNALLDQSCVMAVKRSHPLAPLPSGYDGDSLGVHFTFVCPPR